MIAVLVPIRTVSEANRSRHEHWAVTRKRVKAQHTATTLCLAGSAAKCGEVPASVLLVRIAPRALDDDNLRSSLKAVRDAVAAFFSVDDKPTAPIRWDYSQERGKPKEYAVRIEIR